MKLTHSTLNFSPRDGMRCLLSGVAGFTFATGFLVDISRGVITEESLAISMIRAWIAGELAVIWLRWGHRQPRRTVIPTKSGAETVAPDVEGIG